MATRLFVGNLPDNTAEDDLHSAFSSYGQITNLDLKSKSAEGSEKKFAFVTIAGSNYDIETCIKHFSNENFNGNKLYVTRARESFLERLQRERLETQQKEREKAARSPKVRRKVRIAPDMKLQWSQSVKNKDVDDQGGTSVSQLKRRRRTDNSKKGSLAEEEKVVNQPTVFKHEDKLNSQKRTIEERAPRKRDAHQASNLLDSSLRQIKTKKCIKEWNVHKIFEENAQYGDGPHRSGITTEIHSIKNDQELEYKPHIKVSKNNSKNVNTRPENGFVNTNVFQNGDTTVDTRSGNTSEMYKKKQDSDNKRIEAMKKKSKEFKQKKMIVKSGLTDVDKVVNKKIIFSDNEDDAKVKKDYNKKPEKLKSTLFDNDDDDDSGNELNFEIKKQFEGKKGQKVLDLQSRYKSDKRFVLDERFIEEEAEADQDFGDNEVELNQVDERAKQLNILEDVLGVPIRKKIPEEERDGKKNKVKLGMLRFDPSQPGHSKFLAPVEDIKHDSTKRNKKKKDKQTEIEEQTQNPPKAEDLRPEVSKEQFYKVSDTLKEAIAQPTTFSLRSLFGNTEAAERESKEDVDYINIEPPKKSKIRNPLQPGEKNPFVYDSSESETEEVEETKTTTAPVVSESKAVWKENFFLGLTDQRFEEGLAFFSKTNEPEANKERRELKSLVKKRIYNKERKDQMQMFRKKIGGRKKTMKKSFRRKN